MAAIVNKIEKGSIAEKIGLHPGDILVSIDGIIPKDLLDYKFLICSDNIELCVRKNGKKETEIIQIEKDEDEDLGIIFESAVFDRVIPCANNCIFCFVDQQPEGLRESLYVKDDDYRLSYLQGTYITLTNLTKNHRQRIEALRPGPLYVSVHTTNPELRVKMLKNPKAANIMSDLKWLNSLDIPVHAQIVLCPGINDGIELDKTLKDLYKLCSNIMSVAVVPIGITKYRNESELKPFYPESSKEVIKQINLFNSKAGSNFAFPSDEFYFSAEIELPKYEFYGSFSQLEDGIGQSRMLLEDFEKYKPLLPKALHRKKSIAIATGEISANVLKNIASDLNKIENLEVFVIPVKSSFWGSNITVSGLITASDLIKSVILFKKYNGQKISTLVIPSVMLRKYTDNFLDGVSLEEVKQAIGSEILVVEDYFSTKELIGFIIY